jgi:hypothetical protein
MTTASRLAALGEEFSAEPGGTQSQKDFTIRSKPGDLVR